MVAYVKSRAEVVVDVRIDKDGPWREVSVHPFDSHKYERKEVWLTLLCWLKKGRVYSKFFQGSTEMTVASPACRNFAAVYVGYTLEWRGKEN